MTVSTAAPISAAPAAMPSTRPTFWPVVKPSSAGGDDGVETTASGDEDEGADEVDGVVEATVVVAMGLSATTAIFSSATVTCWRSPPVIESVRVAGAWPGAFTSTRTLPFETRTGA